MKYNYTDKFRTVLELCFRSAINNSIEEIDADLLVWSIIKEGTNIGLDYLLSKGFDRDILLSEFESRLGIKQVNNNDFIEPMRLVIPRVSKSLSVDIDRSLRICLLSKDMAITPLHLIYGVLLSDSDNLLKSIFDRENVLTPELEPIRDSLNKHSLSDILSDNLNAIKNFLQKIDPDINPLTQIKIDIDKDKYNNAKDDTTLIPVKIELKNPSNNDNVLNEDGVEDIKGEDKKEKKGLFGEIIPIKSLADLRIISPQMEEKESFDIHQFGTYITDLAKENKIDEVICRDDEIDRLVEILCRRKKNNPIIIGDAGVGKTSVVEGLALRIVKKQVPGALIDKKIFCLDIGSLIAGTKFRGEFEERVKFILKYIEDSHDTILFIDEIHVIVGSGGQQGGASDMSSLIKPVLNMGNIQFIGTTTTDEYKRTIEKDKALDRRFQKISISPMSKESTMEIIQRIKPKYEEHHSVVYTKESIKSIIDLCDKYINDRFFPDKAIDVLDEVGAHVSKKEDFYSRIKTLKRNLESTSKDREDLLNKGKYENVIGLLELEEGFKQDISTLEKEKEKSVITVNSCDVEKVLSQITKIPIENLSLSENERLRLMKEKLSNTIIGQDNAVDKVCRIVQRGRLGLRSMNKPIGSFLFLGSTGVGKTEMAKQLSEYLFGSQDSMIRVDMSEYMEKFAVSRLIGAPPGYVGYGDGGLLTEKVRRNPYSLILFDEMEKAHPDVYNILLQIMDDGFITDSEGNKIDFRHTVIIMTSNVGSRKVKEFSNAIGYNESYDKNKYINNIFDKELRRSFSPEFLNRIDEIIEFNSLSKENIRKIVDLEIKKMISVYKDNGYKLSVSNKVRDIITDSSYSSEYGARPLKRRLQREIDDRVVEMILSKGIEKNSKIKVKTNTKSEIIVEID